MMEPMTNSAKVIGDGFLDAVDEWNAGFET